MSVPARAESTAGVRRTGEVRHRKYRPPWDRRVISRSHPRGQHTRTAPDLPGSRDNRRIGDTCDMAGQAHRDSRGHEPSSRPDSSSALLAASAAGPGGGVASAISEPRPATASVTTRATYRALLAKGLASEEAANLTAFLCGLPIADVRWDLCQVNRLLFLRELERTGSFGLHDGGPTGSY